MTSTRSPQPETIPLWPGAAPGSEHWTHQEQEGVAPPPFNTRDVRNVNSPSLLVYPPDPAHATGTAVIVAPGGAFHGLAIEHEGIDVARWLNARGVTAFVLKYRVLPTPRDDEAFARQMRANMQLPVAEREVRLHRAVDPIVPLAVADGRRAMQLVRERAAEWDLDPDRIGMMGFSAGGRVTAGVALDHDETSRPAFAGVVYGVTWHEIVVPPDPPPLFIALASNDDVAVQSCLDLYAAWWSNGHSAELHMYADGGHGFGMRKQGLPSDTWIDRFGDWLGAQGLLTRQWAAATSGADASRA